MISRFKWLPIFAAFLFLASCNNGPDINYSYTFDAFGDSSLSIILMDELILDVPSTITDFDSVSIVFPSSGKEQKFKPTKYYDYTVQSPRIDSLFKENDSVQLLFRRNRKIIFKPFLRKEIDTISSSGTIKLCRNSLYLSHLLS